MTTHRWTISEPRSGASLSAPLMPAMTTHRKVWNGSIDRHPALIARCTGVADVLAAVRFARKHELLTAVRGGGHSFPGHFDLRWGHRHRPRSHEGDPRRSGGRTVRAQAGVLLGELDHETQAFGLAVPAGIVTHTGIAGLTLGGGTGWIQRKYGLSIDNLLSVDLVTADGRIRQGQRHGERRPLLGRARRWRQLWHRHRVRVPPESPGPPGDGRPRLLADGRSAQGAALLPRLDRRLPRRAHDDPRAAQGAGAAGHASRTGGQARDRRRRLLRGPRRGRAKGSCGRSSRSARPCWTCASPSRSSSTRHRSTRPFRTAGGTMCGPAMWPGSTTTSSTSMAEYGSRIVSPDLERRPLADGRGGRAASRENETAFNGRNAGFTFNINGNSQSADGFDAERQWARTTGPRWRRTTPACT